MCFFFFFCIFFGDKPAQLQPSDPSSSFHVTLSVGLDQAWPSFHPIRCHCLTAREPISCRVAQGLIEGGSAKMENFDLQDIKLLSKAPLKRDSANIFPPDWQNKMNKSKMIILDLFLATACAAGFRWPGVTPPSGPWGRAPGVTRLGNSLKLKKKSTWKHQKLASLKTYT